MTEPGNSPASRDIAYLVHPYTNLASHRQSGPMIITRGQGVRVYDDAGRGYIEGLAGLWCTSLGFGEERLIKAAETAMRELPYYHTFGGKSTPAVIDLAERLINMAPPPASGAMSKVLFANSGSEAIDTAIKLVWYYNNARGRAEKKKVLSRLRAYHGVTVAAASLTGLDPVHRDFDLPLERMIHAGCPHHYGYGQAGESEEDFASRLAGELDEMIVAEGPDTVAAMFVEPIMGAGGVLLPPAGYFEKIQRVLKKHDVLLVADEVICGFGRTGNMFGCQTFGIQPDMMTVAKALSSAYLPISALVVSEDIYQAMLVESDKIGTFGHGFTYGGHPVAAAVALETLKIYEERDIVGQVRSVQGALQSGLRGFADHPLVGEARGIGLIGALELVKDKKTKEPFDASHNVAAHLAARCQAHGLIIRPIINCIAFAPPLIVTEADIAEMMAAVGKALDDTLVHVRGLGIGG